MSATGKHPWPLVRLGEVLSRSEEMTDLQPDADYKEVTVRMHGKGVVLRGIVKGAEIASARRAVVRPGQFLLARIDARQGACGIVPRDLDGAVVTNDFPAFAVNKARLDGEFLGWLSRTQDFVEKLKRASEGTTNRVRLQEDKFLALEIPLPPLPEQRRLVARLADLADRLAVARKLREEAEQEGAALMSRTLAHCIDARAFPSSPLGNLLKESPRNGMAPKEESESGTRLMLRINAVSSSSTRFVDTTGTKRVQFEDTEAKPFLLQHNDIFIVRYNGDINRVAKSAIFKSQDRKSSPIAYPDKLMRLRADESQLDSDYLVHALSAPSVRAQVDELGKTTAGNIGINAGNVKAFRIPVPPLAEQRRIVAELDALQARVDAMKAHQAATAAELVALLPALLDRAFKGEL